MRYFSNPVRSRILNRFAAAAFLISLISLFGPSFFVRAAWANDSAEAFMSVTFGLSSSRTQTRMENSGATVVSPLGDGRLTMRGTFEHRPAIFIFGFHNRRGLNHKSVYIASSGSADLDRAFYDAFREAYNIRFGRTDERALPHRRVRGRITFQNTWHPNRDTIISLSYDPEATNRFPGDSPRDRPIRLVYNFTRWTQ